MYIPLFKGLNAHWGTVCACHMMALSRSCQLTSIDLPFFVSSFIVHQPFNIHYQYQYLGQPDNS
jgi:hypothetical protein